MKLIFVGDIMLGRLINEVLALSGDYALPWGDTLPIFQSSDINFGNLECVMTNKGKPWSKTPKEFLFRSNAQNIEVLKEGKIDIVSLANNHVLDYEEEGLISMLNLLEKNGIKYVGAGRNIFDAEKPVIIEKNGLKTAYFSFTDNEPNWEAEADKPGIFYAPVNPVDGRILHLMDEIEKVRGTVDLIVVSIHWGPNWGYENPEEHRVFARHLIDSGADIIAGHSPHIFRGIEIYKNRPIFYSLGDFIDDYAVDEEERNDQSFIYQIEVDENKVITKIRLFPTIIFDMHAILAPGNEAERIANKMIELSQEFGTKMEWLAYNDILEIDIGAQ